MTSPLNKGLSLQCCSLCFSHLCKLQTPVRANALQFLGAVFAYFQDKARGAKYALHTLIKLPELAKKKKKKGDHNENPKSLLALKI